MSYRNAFDKQREEVKRSDRNATVYYLLALACLTIAAVGLLSIIGGC